MFRPSIAYLHQIFKRKAKTKNNKNKNERRSNTTTVVMPATTAATTTTGGGSHILPASSECYDRGKLWRSWSFVHPSCSSSEKGEEAESEGEEQKSPRAQSAQCAANKNKNKVPQSIEAWWMDPALLQVRRRCSGSAVAGVVGGSSRSGWVAQGEGAWWTEQR